MASRVSWEPIEGRVRDCGKTQEVLNRRMEKYQPIGGYRRVGVEETDHVALMEIIIEDLPGRDCRREP